jgi:hypothetical protein
LEGGEAINKPARLPLTGLAAAAKFGGQVPPPGFELPNSFPTGRKSVKLEGLGFTCAP